MNRAEELRIELRDILSQLEQRRAVAAETAWCPQKPTPRQAEFLELDSDDALYGGAAGGGKSSALLMAGLRWVDVPGYSGLIVRRTFRDLSLPGAIMDRAGEWLRPTGAKWTEIDKTWTFPSGARLTFGFMEAERDKYRYQGAEFQFIGVDEATQFSESQYRYLRTRLRRKEGFEVPPHSRCASNPGGEGHQWCFERFVEEGSPFPFIPAFAKDNPHLDVEDYVTRLEDLDEVTRAQLLLGAWILDVQGLIYPIEKSNIIPEKPPLDDRWRYVLGVDLGASLEKATTAFAVCGWHPQVEQAVWTLEAHKHAAMGVSAIANKIEDLRSLYGGFNRIVVDEGALGLAYGTEFRDRFAIYTEPAQKRDKAGFRKLMRGAIQRKQVMVVEDMCEELIEEVGKLRFDEHGLKESKHAANHCSDAWLYAWRECRAYAARAPAIRYRQGSPKWFAEWERQTIERERKEATSKKAQPRKWYE